MRIQKIFLKSFIIDSIEIIVSRKSKADVYKRITELWEKKRMAEFAVANA